MIEYILTVALILFSVGYYKLHYKPKKQLLWYKNKLEQLGYKVKMFPYKLLKSGIFTQRIQAQKKYEDAFYFYKNQYVNYDIILCNTGTTLTLQFQNKDLIKSFFQPENVYLHQKMKFITQNMQRTFGHGIFLSEGQEWKRKRSIMNVVLNYQFISENIPKISRICDQGLQYMEEQCENKGKITLIDGKKTYKVQLYDFFARMFSQVMVQCFFGTNSNNETINGQPLYSFLNKLNADIVTQSFEPLMLLFGAKFATLGLRKKDRDINHRLKLWKKIAGQLIKKRLVQLQQKGPRQKHQDIIQAMVLKKKFAISSEQNQKLNFEKKETDAYDLDELIEQFCTFFIAGNQSSSRFTQMMIYYISQRKDVQEKLRAQINEVIKSDSDITRENLKKLTYIDWIQNQTRRYYGPGTGIFPRMAVKDHYISNIPIKKGTSMNIQPASTHYNQKYFKNPKQFKPERWGQSQIDINNLMGFGGGPRSCIGKHLALLDTKIGLVKFMRRYKSFKLPKQQIKMCYNFGYEPQILELTFEQIS